MLGVSLLLGYMPSFYQDELLFSYLSRYHSWSLNRHEKISRGELYKQKYPKINTEFPINVKGIWDQIQMYNPPSIYHVINKHTFLTFCRNLCEKSQVNNALDTLLEGKRKFLINVNDKPFFQYCPDCLQEDYEKYGESYWRMTFQLPTVLVCSKHQKLLSDSEVEFNTGIFYYATRDNCTEITKKKTTKKTSFHLKRLADESTKLAQIDYNYPREKWYLKFFIHLNKKGYLNKRGKILNNKLVRDIISFYGIEFLAFLQIDLEILESRLSKYNWLNRMNPKQSLIVILFLCSGFKEFYEEQISLNGIKTQCNNPVCEFYLKDNLIDVEVIEEYEYIKLQVRCCCGYCYNIIFNDQFNSKISIDIISYGRKWSETLYDLAYNKNYSLDRLSRVFKCNKFDIEEFLLTKIENINYVKDPVKKEQWLKILDELPNEDLAEIKHQYFTIYSWLYRFQYTWFYYQSNYYINEQIQRHDFWLKRDRELKCYLKNYVWKLLNQGYSAKEIRIKLSNKIELLDLQRELFFLPRTRNYIRFVVRSYIHNK